MRIEQVEIEGSICLVIKEVYDGVIFETAEGNRIAVCMRDDTFEIAVMAPDGSRMDGIQRVDMNTGIILPIGAETDRYTFDPNGMRPDKAGLWLKLGTPRCQHPEAMHVGDVSVYECACGQRVPMGYTEKKY